MIHRAEDVSHRVWLELQVFAKKAMGIEKAREDEQRRGKTQGQKGELEISEVYIRPGESGKKDNGGVWEKWRDARGRRNEM